MLIELIWGNRDASQSPHDVLGNGLGDGHDCLDLEAFSGSGGQRREEMRGDES